MIIINLMGGLGNQMFQYAAAKHLSLIHDTQLRIDASRFRKLTLNKEHVFQLDRYNITARQASGDEIRQCRPRHKLSGLFVRSARALIPRAPGPGTRRDLRYEEPAGSAFKQGFFELGPDAYLVGYFNSYKYFDAIRNLLIEEFTPKGDVSRNAQEMIRRIEGTHSVGVHIRRGDYVDDPNVRRGIEGIITDRYYRNAVAFIAERIEHPHFFVFSNDMDWVKINFEIPFTVTFVDINSPQKGYEDLWMMSKCRHTITAGGSTFSWWAAYLNRNPDKIVVRTGTISNDPPYNHPDDYFPPEWNIAAS